MKQYGLYNLKDHEQCEYFGSLKEIANYLELSYSYIRIYMTRKRQGKQDLIKHRYALIEMEDNNA